MKTISKSVSDLIILLIVGLVGYAFYVGYPKGRDTGHPRPEKWEINDPRINLKASALRNKTSYQFPIEIDLKDGSDVEWIFLIPSADPQTWIIEKKDNEDYKSFMLKRSE